MAHEIWASVVVKLPDDGQAMAKQVALFADAWAKMLAAAGENPVTGFNVIDSTGRVGVSGTNGTRRKHRRRNVTTAEQTTLSIVPPPS